MKKVVRICQPARATSKKKPVISRIGLVDRPNPEQAGFEDGATIAGDPLVSRFGIGARRL